MWSLAQSVSELVTPLREAIPWAQRKFNDSPNSHIRVKLFLHCPNGR